MVGSLREIRAEPLVGLKHLCEEGQLTLQGEIKPDDLTLIEQKVMASKLIERKYKKRNVRGM